MADNIIALYRHQGNRKLAAAAQCIDNILLRMTCVCLMLECCLGQLGNGQYSQRVRCEFQYSS